MPIEAILLLALKITEFAMTVAPSAPQIAENARSVSATIRRYRERGLPIPDAEIDKLMDLDRELSAEIARKAQTPAS